MRDSELWAGVGAGAAFEVEVEESDGIFAFTSTRAAGSFGFVSQEAVVDVMERWRRLQALLGSLGISRLVSAHQVHGKVVSEALAGWSGWLRLEGVDGHVTRSRGTALAVTVADCTPIFITHPSGVVAVLHAGWRGAAAGILGEGLNALSKLGAPAIECSVRLGASICGSCYEVGPEVLSEFSGRTEINKGLLDVRSALAEMAYKAGVAKVSISDSCTLCHNDRFFSHRGGDIGRQLGIVALLP